MDNDASVSFLAPLDLTLAGAFWDKVAADVDNQQRIVLTAHAPEDGRLIGTAQLAFASVPNGRHRAEVQKMLVLRSARRQGIARALLLVLDEVARAAGKSLLVLDTARGGGAETLYESCGYVRVGAIPDYALAPYVGYVDTIIFYKVLDEVTATRS